MPASASDGPVTGPTRLVSLLDEAEQGGAHEQADPGRPELRDDLERLDADLRRARRPGWLTMPEQLRTGRWQVSSAAVVALLALLVALGCAFILRILWAERAAQHATAPERTALITSAAEGRGEPQGNGPSGTAVPDSTDPASDPGQAPTTQTEVVVHVVGQVARPGLVRLTGGSRVADAVQAAGGATKAADLGAVNLARAVVDGEQVIVPRPGEQVQAVPGSGPVDGGAGSGTGGGAVAGAPINLNTATLDGLDSLPGVGPVLAQRILDWRAEHGRFSSVDELREVSGIGDKLMGQLRTKVTV